jgi:hypothetical protein
VVSLLIGAGVIGTIVTACCLWIFTPVGLQNWLEQREYYRYRVARRRIKDSAILTRRAMRK